MAVISQGNSTSDAYLESLNPEKGLVENSEQINIIKRFFILFRSSNINAILEHRYPEIFAGQEFPVNMNDDKTKEFFSLLYSRHAISYVLNLLLNFNARSYCGKARNGYDVYEQNAQLIELMEGRKIISNSPLTSALRRVAREYMMEGVEYEFVYKIGFILALPKAQRDRYLDQFIQEHRKLNDLHEFIDEVRQRLITVIIDVMKES